MIGVSELVCMVDEYIRYSLDFIQYLQFLGLNIYHINSTSFKSIPGNVWSVPSIPIIGNNECAATKFYFLSMYNQFVIELGEIIIINNNLKKIMKQ